MTKLSWHEEEVPKDLQIKQVYGVLFSNDQRILLMKKMLNGKPFFSLSGGTPEVFDETLLQHLNVNFLKKLTQQLTSQFILAIKRLTLKTAKNLLLKLEWSLKF